MTETMPPITIEPATSDRCPDLAPVFATTDEANACWCQFFVDADWSAENPGANRSALCKQLGEQKPEPGLIAYAGNEAVGWVQVAPRSYFQNLDSPAADDVEHAWEITCFVIREEYRGRGIATGLLAAAVEHARAHGATTVRARPIDPHGRRLGDDDLYTGVLDHFTAAGFTPIGDAEDAVLVELRLDGERADA